MNFYPLFDDLFEFMKTNQLAPWLDTLIPLLKQKLQVNPHGDLKRWQAAFDQLPDIQADLVHLNQSRVGASLNTALDQTENEKTWRKITEKKLQEYKLHKKDKNSKTWEYKRMVKSKIRETFKKRTNTESDNKSKIKHAV